MTQGAHLKRLLAKAGLSQAELSRRSGVARETITKICSDKRGLGDDVAAKLAPHLGVSVTTLVLPRTAQAASRRDLDGRLEAVEGEIRWLREQIAVALSALGLAPAGSEPPVRSGGDRR